MDLESKLLAIVKDGAELEDTYVWSKLIDVDHNMVVGTMNSLIGDGYLLSTAKSEEFWVLTEEAEGYVTNGSPELQLFRAIPVDGADETGLVAALGEALVKVGLGKCMKSKWISRDKASGRYFRSVESVERDDLVEQLLSIKNGALEDSGLIKDLKKRQLIAQMFVLLSHAAAQRHTLSSRLTPHLLSPKLQNLRKRTSYKVTAGPKWAPVRAVLSSELTKEMLDSGEWATATFRKYNFEAAGREPGGGHLHALMRVRAEFRQILLEMGFNEMPTNRWVESSFWNFDALFQPQSHPARDAHDTFFLTTPSRTVSIPEDLLSRVQAMHEGGGGGSLGYRYSWKRGEGEKNLLRTHTTAVSARMLYALANAPGGFKPAKLFSIDRVFRNEALDATHLAEFHQVEGVVADVGLTLGDLVGVITEFFRRIGITDLRFKPAYNPYTEPSMEVFGYHPDLKKWTEIGNSGIFRPEMLLPLGLPPDVRVIAWGLSLERPTMIKYRCKNIRELFGHKSKLEMTRSAPIARF